MSLKDAQKDVNEWTSQFTPQYWKPHEILARLMEEVGELSREINHSFGPKKKKDNESDSSVGDELCDIIFTVICMANSNKINLQHEWEKMMKEKQYGRDKNRFKKK